ncbi:hypothetical protein DXG03_003932 [Asterophora parasitica]|uniref:Uncharacterized protein n=1 Tax=Asterophora parasitica TaxID=117018 RepID=A0A9P7G4I4_9AGAR|nr:hypothetical protein DXG03_003932 [Asterophora parasitica]
MSKIHGLHEMRNAEREIAASSNQGIHDGRPEGSGTTGEPGHEARVTMDTYVDEDATGGPDMSHTSAEDTMTGATSKDVDRGVGHPIYGMSSKEMHHDGRPGRKREKQLHTAHSIVDTTPREHHQERGVEVDGREHRQK